MSTSSLVTLGSLRLQAQQRVDMENNPLVSVSEWNQYLTFEYKKLYNLLIGAYGEDYSVASAFPFTVSQFVSLPNDFYKLLGVDLQYSASPTGWVTLRRFEFIERNKFSYPSTNVNYSGYSNLRYRLTGSQLQFNSVYATGSGQLWYIPEPTSLQFSPSAALTVNSPIITVSDIGNLVVGMSVNTAVGIPDGTTIQSINTSTKQVTLTANATMTIPIATVQFWIDSTTIDGIAGWEEFVILGAAIKAGLKQESDVSALMLQQKDIRTEIEALAEGRDAGQAHHVSDVLSINGYDDGDGFGGPGSGFGGF